MSTRPSCAQGDDRAMCLDRDAAKKEERGKITQSKILHNLRRGIAPFERGDFWPRGSHLARHCLIQASNDDSNSSATTKLRCSNNN
jgi:hypothetical protein